MSSKRVMNDLYLARVGQSSVWVVTLSEAILLIRIALS